MSGLRVGLVALLGTILVATTSPVPAQSSLEAVQRKMIDFSGGSEAWDRISALELAGVRNRNGYEMGLVVWLARPDRVRVEHTLRGQREIFVWNGERGWLAGFGEGQSFRALSEDECQERLDEVEKYLRWPEVWNRFASVRLDGVEEREEGPAERLLLTPKTGETETWLVDSGSGRVVEIIEPRIGEEGERYEERSYAWDYRQVGEILLPFYVEMDHGTALYSIVVESVEIDPPLDGVFFAPVLEEAGPVPSPP